MKKTEIINSIRGSMNRLGFTLKKHSPEILIVVGVVGTVASAVMACRATMKVTSILDRAKEDIDTIHKCENDKTLPEPYTKKDADRDLTIVYFQTGIKFVKLYAPSVLLGAFSITSILTSHKILRERNVALAAAYATIDKGYKEYRKRVVDRFGENVDRELKYNIKAKKHEENVTDEFGEEYTVEKEAKVSDLDEYSDYARFFDEANDNWEKNPDYNLMFLRGVQQWANDRLIAKGYLFLNDVYEALDIPVTKAGQVVGWIYNPDHPTGDNYVDFGIYEYYNERKREFLNGNEPSILLDFNVDGYILDQVEKARR